MAEQLITMTHPKVGKPYQARPSQVGALARSGWVREGESQKPAVKSDRTGPPPLDSAAARAAKKEND